MARNSEHWERWNHYQNTGEWLPTQKQKNTAAAATRAKAEAQSSQINYAGINPNVSSELARSILNWHEENPDNAAYDNDGNPIEHD
jgi:hypothetical protein